MEEIPIDYQSLLVWGSTQDLPTWSKSDDEKSEEQPRTTQQELVDDLKAVGTQVTKMTISNTLNPPTQGGTCTDPSEVCK